MGHVQPELELVLWWPGTFELLNQVTLIESASSM